MANIPDQPAGKSPTRSIRVDADTWELAKDRAEREGMTISRVLYLLTEGYARGEISAPTIQVVYGS